VLRFRDGIGTPTQRFVQQFLRLVRSFPLLDHSSETVEIFVLSTAIFQQVKRYEVPSTQMSLQCLTTPMHCWSIARGKPPTRAAMNRRPTQTGLTLIELLIAMVIVAVLAAIAYPSYQNHVRKGHRAAAQSLLLHIADREAQYALDARNYAVGPDALADLSVTLPNDVAAYYTVSIENSSGGTAPETPPSFRIRATPIPGSRQAADGELALTHDGLKTRGGNPGW
jgi:type IV pilus assembly protein PilE